VGIATPDDSVCPGDSMDVVAKVANDGNCADLFLVTVGLKIFDINVQQYVPDFAGKSRCLPMLPKLMIPLDAGGSFSFTYSGRVPKIVPPGDYTLTIKAKGRAGGAEAFDDFTFTVEDCREIP
jgi:hypothetical protein